MEFITRPISCFVPSRVRNLVFSTGKDRLKRQDLRYKRESLSSLISVLPQVLPSSFQNRLSPYASGSTTPASSAETLVGSDTFTDDEAVAEDVVLAAVEVVAVAGEEAAPAKGKVAPKEETVTSGVDWRCGRLGMELMLNAAHEYRQSGSPEHYVPFERSTYIDGVSYLLRGLPPDLDETELAALRQSLPAPVGEPGASLQMEDLQTPRPGAGRSVLQGAIRLLVAQVIVWFCFAWPRVLHVVRWAAHYERKYRVSESIVGQSVMLANAFGRQGANISTAFLNLGDGRVGQLLMSALAWTVQSMAGGFSEGVVEGMAKVGPRRQL